MCEGFARAVSVPVLFKEFVLHEVQLDLAAEVGASLVLLLARALSPQELQRLVSACVRRGLEPLVEAADSRELEQALDTDARLIGINARDLRTFTVDAKQAHGLIERIPSNRVAVYMSGVRSKEDFQRVNRTRADAVLIGEGLMRAADPGSRLARWMEAVR